MERAKMKKINLVQLHETIENGVIDNFVIGNIVKVMLIFECGSSNYKFISDDICLIRKAFKKYYQHKKTAFSHLGRNIDFLILRDIRKAYKIVLKHKYKI
jgi:hypothetical protein